MNYREDIDVSKKAKELYADGLDRLISKRERSLVLKRDEYVKNIFTDAEAYREDLRRLFGWPLADHKREGIPFVKKEKLSREDGYTIYRMSFEILSGLELSGLYFEMDGEEKKPLVLVQHGGLGTPEHIAGIDDTDTSNYNHMLERVVAYGVHVFAPQLFLWDQEKYGVSRDRTGIDARLKRVGSSITAVEVYGLTRILDYFEGKKNVSNFGMVGLSYGGFYTLVTSALDTRIKSAVSCSFFNTRDKYPWCDWTWFGFADKFDDAEIACLVYPRKLCIEIGGSDPLFDAEYGVRSYERLKELCGEARTDWLKFIKFDGVHEFCKDDAPIEALVKHIS